MTTIFDNAARIRQLFADCGEPIGELSCSTNRHGENSAYFDISGGFRIRVSDHSCNGNFRVAEINVSETVDLATVRGVIDQFDINARANAARRAAEDAEDAEIAAYEAPFIARFQAAKQHEQHDIVVEAYPAAVHNKAMRRTIVARWSKEG